MLREYSKRTRTCCQVWKATGFSTRCWLCVYRPLSTAQIIRAAVASTDRNTQRAVDELAATVFEIPKIFPLKTLLEAYSSRNNLSVPNEPDMVDRELKLKQRKKRRGLRR
jgi:hypothetical protein